MSTSKGFIGDFRILLTDQPDLAPPGSSIQVAEQVVGATFRVDLLDFQKALLAGLSENAVAEGVRARLVDREQGLEMTFHQQGQDGKRFVIGTASFPSGRIDTTAIFVAEDDGGKGGEG